MNGMEPKSNWGRIEMDGGRYKDPGHVIHTTLLIDS